MTQSEKVTKTLRDCLPMLADYAKHEDALHAVLMGLYDAGLTDGRSQLDGILKSLTADVVLIVDRHIHKDAVGLIAALDDFVARRCIISGDAPNKTQVVH